MRPHNVTRLAWAIWATSIALVAGALLLGIANRPEVPLFDFWLEATLSAPVFATLGALIVLRRPGNVIGWIFLVPSVAGGIQFFTGQYATVALNPGGPELPGGAVAAWFSNLMQLSAVVAFLFLILLFPTGTLLSARSRIIVWAAGVAFIGLALALAFTPGPLENFPFTQNPFGIGADSAVFSVTGAVASGMALACFVAAVVTLILRFRGSRGEERLQLKWFVYAAGMGLSLILLSGFFVPHDFDDQFGSLVWTLGPLGLPVGAGIAILRYRLYEIDLLINRTLVYGGLTVLLVLIYVAGVVGLGGTLRSLLGQEDNNLAVAASTLAVAALFRPARARIQSFIDRRFYRAKYDATQTLESFGARVRDQVDLDELTGDLLVVVKHTMQPAHASLWLRGPGISATALASARSLRSYGRLAPISAQTSDGGNVR